MSKMPYMHTHFLSFSLRFSHRPTDNVFKAITHLRKQLNCYYSAVRPT